MGAAGKRAGARRGPKKRSLPSRRALLLCLGVTVCVVAWGYLVKAAIDFGTSARDGEPQAWGFLGVACLGAAACLFAGLILVGKLLRAAGITSTPAAPASTVARSRRPATPESTETQDLRPPPAPLATARVEETAPLPVVPVQSLVDPTPPVVASRHSAPARPVPSPRRGGGKRAAR